MRYDLINNNVFTPRPPRWFACFFIAAAEPQRTEKGGSGRTAAYGEKQEQRRNRCVLRRKEYSLNIRTMKELLKLWKADCEAEGFSNEDYIVAFKVVVLFSIFLAIL